MRNSFSLTLLFGLIVSFSSVIRAADHLAPEEGEALLAEADAKTALTEMADTFKKTPAFKAKIVSEMDDDLMGKTKKEGELIMQRPGTVLRKFAKPAAALMVEDTFLREYDPATKHVIERDFSKAPKAMALLRAGFTLDVSVLQEYFTINVFKKGTDLRLVLIPKPDKKIPLKFDAVKVRWKSGDAFFYEVDRLPKKGSGQQRVVEKFSDFTALKEVSKADVSDPLLQGKDVDKQPVNELEQ